VRTTPGAWASAVKGVVRAERTRTTTLSTTAITKTTKTPACRIGEMITELSFIVFRMFICSSYELSNLPVKSLFFFHFLISYQQDGLTLLYKSKWLRTQKRPRPIRRRLRLHPFH